MILKNEKKSRTRTCLWHLIICHYLRRISSTHSLLKACSPCRYQCKLTCFCISFACAPLFHAHRMQFFILWLLHACFFIGHCRAPPFLVSDLCANLRTHNYAHYNVLTRTLSPNTGAVTDLSKSSHQFWNDLLGIKIVSSEKPNKGTVLCPTANSHTLQSLLNSHNLINIKPIKLFFLRAESSYHDQYTPIA